MSHQIILASSSSTRKDLMDRLNLNYLAISPDIDESAHEGESADQLALRLSIEKAHVIATQYPDAIVIGSDQVAWLENAPLHFIGKPYTVDSAIKQLENQSGKIVCFSTGLSVQCLAKNIQIHHVVHFKAKFRDLSQAEIQRYVKYEQPLHCAGSFKCERLGLSLFDWTEGTDFTALMGLPLIQLCKDLRAFGLSLP